MSEVPERRALVSGAGIAGSATAYWLARHGWRVTVVEPAPDLRPGGQAVDFKGEVQLRVLERAGVLERLRELRTGSSDGVILDRAGRPRATVPAAFTAGDLEVLRGDLARVLHDAAAAQGCEYVFGDSVAAVRETPKTVQATFRGGRSEAYDIAVGADGIHSAVRRLAFGPERDFVRFLGYHYALADLPEEALPAPPEGSGGAERLWYNEPGLLVSTGGPKAPAFFVFASPEPLPHGPGGAERRRRALLDACAGAGWRVPEIAEAVRTAGDPHVDTISRVRMSRYTRGRFALVGDAAYGNTLGGFGSGLAVVGAYLLAGELTAAAGDHRAAFAGYDRRMHAYAKVARSGNAGRFLAPRTRAGIRARDALFRLGPLRRALMSTTDGFADGIALPDYAPPARR